MRGTLIAEVEPETPALKAHLQSSDVMLAEDGVEVQSSEELPRLVAQHAPGAKVRLTVRHRGQERTVDVVLGALRDDDPTAPPIATAAPRAATWRRSRGCSGQGRAYRAGPSGERWRRPARPR